MTPKPRNLFSKQTCSRVGLMFFVFLFSVVAASAEIPTVKEGLGAPNSQQGNLPPLPEAPIALDTINVSDESGASKSLAEYRGQSATVIVFLYDDCPMCKQVAPILEIIWQSERGRGAQFLGVFIDGTSPTGMEKFKKEFGLTFPLIVDTGGKLASALSATAVPEAFVLDRTNTLQYMGRINDAYQVRGELSHSPVREDLKEALDDVLAGSKVRLPRTLAVGCALGLLGTKKTVPPQPAPEVERTITYHQDVAPILRKNCMSCHSAGNAGPFTLTSYDDAVDMLQMGLQEIKARRMPPAQADSDLEITRPNTISPEEVEILRAWIKGGEVEGDPATAAPLAPLPDLKDFQADLGPPDIILDLSEPFNLGPVGSDVYRHQVYQLNNSKDLRVRAIQLLPTDHSIVHHALLAYIPHSEAVKALRDYGGPGPTYAKGDSGPGFWAKHGFGFTIPPPRADGLTLFSFLSGYIPGVEASVAPEDTSFIIPAGSDILVQMHYHRNGKQSQDSSRIGIWLRKEGEISPKMVSMEFIHGDFVVIPAGIKNMPVSGEWTVPEDCSLAGMAPHAHLLAKSMELSADIPGRGHVMLVSMPRWDYDWQQPYYFKTPLFLPKGSKLKATVIYDNSADNARNPYSPPQPVFLGEATTDEMLLPMLMLTAEKQIDKEGLGFMNFVASMNRSIFLRDFYNDNLSFEVQPDGTVLRVGYSAEDGVHHRLKNPVDPTVPASEYEKDQL